jgi:RHS repeat-associated protein
VVGIDYGGSVVRFGYAYEANENNIDTQTFYHRTGMPTPANDYDYDDLDRLTDVEYLSNQSDVENFAMDALGNRTGNQTLRDEGTVNFTVQSSTNRYTSIGGGSISHDDAGNLTVDKDGYEYFYDYENRVVKIEDSSSNEVARYDYDALGRRIRKVDSVAGATTLYYYNPDWQCLAEYSGAGALQRYYVYGNYIDEPLIMHRQSDGKDFYFAQDHLYSTVVLIDDSGSVVERYEYDAYGTAHIMDASYNARTVSSYGNPYTFTGRRLDVLDGGDLLRMHYRHRDYDVYAGRFIQHDPLGVDPGGARDNPFGAIRQYSESMNTYEILGSNTVMKVDPYGCFSMSGFDIQAYDMWYWLPLFYLHGGLVVNGDVVDFGPAEGTNPILGGPGEVPHGTGPGGLITRLVKRNSGRMQAGPKQGKRCCELTEKNVLICIKYVMVEWDGTTFWVVVRDCRHFKRDVIQRCCLRSAMLWE